jgi:hypothetical protein
MWYVQKEQRYPYKVFMGKIKGKRTLAKSKCRWAILKLILNRLRRHSVYRSQNRDQ